MQLQEKKLELLDWIIHINDAAILTNIDKIKNVFLKRQNIKNSNIPEYGCLKGKIIISPDFNEPLDDFKEYSKNCLA